MVGFQDHSENVAPRSEFVQRKLDSHGLLPPESLKEKFSVAQAYNAYFNVGRGSTGAIVSEETMA